MGRNVQSAAVPNSNVLEPPDDFWQRLDADIAEIKQEIKKPTLPPGCFTKAMMISKLGLTEGRAECRLKLLLEAGKITRHGTTGRTVYYKYGK